MRKLKTLEAHNSECLAPGERGRTLAYNNIACPDCSEELVDSSPNITLSSNPMQKYTKCLNCDYTGLRYC